MISSSLCTCHLIYDKGQIAICLKAFYDCTGLVIVPRHLLSDRGLCPCTCVCVRVEEHEREREILDSRCSTITGPLLRRRYLCIDHSVKPHSLCPIHYPKRDTEEVRREKEKPKGSLLLSFLCSSFLPSLPSFSASHRSPPSS